MANVVLQEYRDGVIRLTLNRPERRNALLRELLLRLEECLDAIRADESARVVVFAGNGPVFSSRARSVGACRPVRAAITASSSSFAAG